MDFICIAICIILGEPKCFKPFERSTVILLIRDCISEITNAKKDTNCSLEQGKVQGLHSQRM